MLNLYKLHIFVRVADEGSLSAAAATLYMAHASVSQHVKELEQSLGVQLFQRGRRGVTLTEEGQRLYEHAQAILRLAARAESELTDVHNVTSGKLTMCGTPGVTAFLFPAWLQHFRQEYAHVEVTLNTGTTADVTYWVRHGTCDMGFTEGEPAANTRIAATPIQDVPQFVIIGPKHPWWGRSSVQLADLNNQSVVARQPNSQSRAWLDQVMAQHNIQVDVVAAFDAIEPIKRSVSISDKCFTILPRYAVQTEIEVNQLGSLPVADSDLSRQLWLVRPQGMPPTPFARAFLGTLEGRFVGLAGLEFG